MKEYQGMCCDSLTGAQKPEVFQKVFEKIIAKRQSGESIYLYNDHLFRRSSE